ncbi:glutathione peroxidase [Saccharopolyspora halophila]|uniref:Glutathione peroxidase n=1 Tax=Saccharopolyspora halophila TaxID=405551 RepID=A0ABN3GR39_9PSEU
MSILDVPIDALQGGPANLAQHRGKVVLVVNVASRCGLTQQYGELEQLQRTYAERGFTVLGVPCNQFAAEEPGTPEQIAEFCSTTYGVTFPLTEKVEVNGKRRHPLYAKLARATDEHGHTGDIRWNFEKFLLATDGTVAARFSPQTTPNSFEIVETLEELLPA